MDGIQLRLMHEKDELRMKKSKETAEERAVKQKQFELKQIQDRLEFIPEPTYKFNMGDPVEIGNLKNVIVCDVFAGGKIYEIDYSFIDNNYGRPITNDHCRMYVEWFKIRKPSDNKESFIKNDDIRLQYYSTHLQDLFSKAYHFGVDMEPKYQREYVWEESDKIALIDSIFCNIDIGKFLFNDLRFGEKYCYEIIDGKQRMRTILDFYEDRLEYKGKVFSSLSREDKNHFENYMINVAKIERATPDQVIRYFLMVNRTGKVMSKEHLDKIEAMYVDKN